MGSFEEITEELKKFKVIEKAVRKKNRIQVSSIKKPIYFYVNLAKKYLQQHGEIELCALGMATGSLISISEILKNNNFAVMKDIKISTVEVCEEKTGRTVSKSKLEISMEKSNAINEVIVKTNLKKIEISMEKYSKAIDKVIAKENRKKKEILKEKSKVVNGKVIAKENLKRVNGKS
ncbi:Alba DNA/RNA-binding protein [Zostera marina]|uniref:Alba DNA/RNA-binding protein n=1 Tax=Zostera marina TaxID=29655 RepID=A0A0K9NVD0_ZOSMR|nr:Alba DNA/RNA-binding protein [Zostera marina]